ncbi:MAG TPA: methionyl-tRNA formyltransferase, partial [Isosphaeraceae bacterium]|nr:methionyl-tRNA formyltransferase [Isosphaeraceae bacterium]
HAQDAAKPPLRLIVHKTALADASGLAGQVIATDPDLLLVAAGKGAVRLLTVQIAGKKAMPVSEFLRGHHVWPGDRMGEGPAIHP